MSTLIFWLPYVFSRPGSSVGIATGCGLDGPAIESRWGARFSVPVQTGPGGHPNSCSMAHGSFPGVKSGRGVTLTPHPLLVPWSWKGRVIPLLPLWAVRPVQSLSAFTRVYFTLPQCLYKGALYLYLSACTRVHFTFTSVPVQECALPLPLPQCLYKSALYLYLSACTRVRFTFTSVPVQGCALPLPLPQCLYKGALYLYLYMFRHCRVILRESIISTLRSYTVLIVNSFTNSCSWNTYVTWQGIDYKLPEEDTIVSKHVGVW